MAKSKLKNRNENSRVKSKINFLALIRFLGYLLAVGLIFWGLFILNGYFNNSSIFVVKDIRSNVEIDSQIKEKIYNVSIFKLDQQKIQTELIALHPEYKSIAISKRFPSLVVIFGVKREPFIQLKADKFYLLDRKSVVISFGASEPAANMVTIEIDDINSPLAIGRKFSDARLILALLLLDEWRRSNLFAHLPLQNINATIPEALYAVVDGAQIIFGSGEYRRKLAAFEDLLSGELKGKLVSMEYIDLRYQKVYLGQKNQPSASVK